MQHITMLRPLESILIYNSSILLLPEINPSIGTGWMSVMSVTQRPNQCNHGRKFSYIYSPVPALFIYVCNLMYKSINEY